MSRRTREQRIEARRSRTVNGTALRARAAIATINRAAYLEQAATPPTYAYTLGRGALRIGYRVTLDRIHILGESSQPMGWRLTRRRAARFGADIVRRANQLQQLLYAPRQDPK